MFRYFYFFCFLAQNFWGSTMASCLVRSTPERAVRVRTLTEDMALCSWARHFTLTVPLSTQVYRYWGASKFNAGGNPAMDWHPIQGGVELLLVSSCYWDYWNLYYTRSWKNFIGCTALVTTINKSDECLWMCQSLGSSYHASLFV